MTSLRPSWIDRLADAPRAAIDEAMVPRHFSRGALIYNRTEAPQGLYVIRSGKAAFCIDGANGRRLLLKVLRANELFGESVALDRRPAPVSVEARSELVTGMVPLHRLDPLRRQYAEIDAALSLVAAANLRGVIDVLEEQALMPLAERTINRLQALCREEGWSDVREGPVKLELNQAELAAMLGASRQAVNGELAQLESRGAVRRGFRLIEVLPSLL